MRYTQHVSTKSTKQTRPIPGKQMVENNAGGYVFDVGHWDQFERFLVLGSEGGSYYAKEQNLTVENMKATIECLLKDGKRAVDTIVEFSDKGRTIKNDTAIFALVIACTYGDEETKKYAYQNITKVCRIGTHIFQFCQGVNDLRGWSRGLRNGVSKFYLEKSVPELAHQLIKYQQRNGWSHRDVLRLAHPKTKQRPRNSLFKWVVGKETKTLPVLVNRFEELKTFNHEKAKDVKKVVEYIRDYNFPREAIPTEFLNHKDVWEALLENMPTTALVRNLGKLSSIGLTDSNLSKGTDKVVEKLTNKEQLKKSRIHPLQLLVALKTYSQGKGDKGKLTWNPNTKIVDALNEAFYLAFDSIEPTGKNWLLGVDVSGSMDAEIAGSKVTCREAAAVMAMVTARVEKNHEIMCFSGPGNFKRADISPKDSLETVTSKLHHHDFGSTDCSLPMEHALQSKINVDVFVIYTDNETYAGKRHPVQALADYRKKFNPNAKLAVVGMVANGFTIADPKDKGMIDVIGFDTATPHVLSMFAK